MGLIFQYVVCNVTNRQNTFTITYTCHTYGSTALTLVARLGFTLNLVMLQHLIIQFPLYYLLNNRLPEVKKKSENIKRLSFKTVRGRFRGVVFYRRFQMF